MTSNFALNNEITYREYRYRGWSTLGGLLLFSLVCSVGVVVNIDIASWLFDFEHVWWVAGICRRPGRRRLELCREHVLRLASAQKA